MLTALAMLGVGCEDPADTSQEGSLWPMSQLQVQEVLLGLSKMRPPSQDSIEALDAWCQKLLEPPKPKVP